MLVFRKILPTHMIDGAMVVSSTDLQNEHGAVFFIPKLYSFFVKKEYVFDNFVLQRTQGIINSC